MEFECLICRDNVKLNDELCVCPESNFALFCGHAFHKYCLKEWFRQSRIKTCPICRTVVKDPAPIHLRLELREREAASKPLELNYQLETVKKRMIRWRGACAMMKMPFLSLEREISTLKAQVQIKEQQQALNQSIHRGIQKELKECQRQIAKLQFDVLMEKMKFLDNSVRHRRQLKNELEKVKADLAKMKKKCSPFIGQPWAVGKHASSS